MNLTPEMLNIAKNAKTARKLPDSVSKIQINLLLTGVVE